MLRDIKNTKTKDTMPIPSYREVQAQAKKMGLKATGTKTAILARIHESSAVKHGTRLPRTGPKSFKQALAKGQLAAAKSTNSQTNKRRANGGKSVANSKQGGKRSRKSSSSSSSTSSFASSDVQKADINDLANLSRDEIQERFNISGQKGRTGTTFIATGRSGAEYAIKLFKADRSSNSLKKEADCQEKAAAYGVSPHILAINTKDKFIIMEKMKETIVDYMTREHPDRGNRILSTEYQERIIEICERLDQAGVVQNDGNPLNLMLDDTGKLFVIDYGFAKVITKAVTKKRGPEPNINLTLWHFNSQLKHYGIKAPLCGARVKSYMDEFKR